MPVAAGDPFRPAWRFRGHARSPDLVHWEHLPTAIAPSLEEGTYQHASGSPVSLIDMAPMTTKCELDGLEPRACFDGESLMPLARGETSDCRGWAMAMYSGVTCNTMSGMLRKGDYKLMVYDGYPSRLFNLKDDPEELHDLIEKEPARAAELLAIIDAQVDRAATYRTWEEHRRHNWAQFQRQAKDGLYYDNSYSLAANPSSDYRALMDNTFTGWTEKYEARVQAWLDGA